MLMAFVGGSNDLWPLPEAFSLYHQQNANLPFLLHTQPAQVILAAGCG